MNKSLFETEQHGWFGTYINLAGYHIEEYVWFIIMAQTGEGLVVRRINIS